MCLAGNTPPDETSPLSTAPCPLLDEKGLCRVYEGRPFACRAMCSEEICQPGGQAAMPPFLVTVNLAIYQILEHLDKTGWYGNLLDLVKLWDKGKISSHEVISLKGRVKTNRELECFIVPPEDKVRFRSFYRRLCDYKLADGRVLGYYLPKDVPILS